MYTNPVFNPATTQTLSLLPIWNLSTITNDYYLIRRKPILAAITMLVVLTGKAALYFRAQSDTDQPAPTKAAIPVAVASSHLLDASPTTLSGGESRRVAIARALLTSPRLLLMDEPLTALDDASRHEILRYLQPLFEQLAIPGFYVSHLRDEIEKIAGHHIIMEQGRLRL